MGFRIVWLSSLQERGGLAVKYVFKWNFGASSGEWVGGRAVGVLFFGGYRFWTVSVFSRFSSGLMGPPSVGNSCRAGLMIFGLLGFHGFSVALCFMWLWAEDVFIWFSGAVFVGFSLHLGFGGAKLSGCSGLFQTRFWDSLPFGRSFGLLGLLSSALVFRRLIAGRIALGFARLQMGLRRSRPHGLSVSEVLWASS
ncbi:MAG TPA: hypothetical protein PK971_16045, partial [Saprospiraceae bacterium]|nr:hypothetical protein [Saprospiraceae bacterium]